MRINDRALIALATAACLALLACDQDDAKWEIQREIQHGFAADAEQTDQMWIRYRGNVVRSLDLMQNSLRSARGAGSVADSSEIDALTSRVGDLKRAMVEEVDTPPERSSEKRSQLRQSFESLRGDVDATLTRLGHNPDEIARWQDKQ